jgi:hypothetical protein
MDFPYLGISELARKSVGILFHSSACFGVLSSVSGLASAVHTSFVLHSAKKRPPPPRHIYFTTVSETLMF